MLIMDKQFGTIYDIFSKAVTIAKQTSERVKFEFNGCWFVVDDNSYWNDRIGEYVLRCVRNGETGVKYL